MIVFFLSRLPFFFCQKTTAVSWCMWHKFHQHYNWLLTNVSAISYHMWLLLQLAQKIGQICCHSIYCGPTFNCKYQVVFFCKCYLLDFLYMLLLHSKRLDGKKTMLYGMSDISTIHGPRLFFFLNYQVVLLFSKT